MPPARGESLALTVVEVTGSPSTCWFHAQLLDGPDIYRASPGSLTHGVQNALSVCQFGVIFMEDGLRPHGFPVNLPVTTLPFEVGALYNRSREIHGVFGGQRQGGISTPKNSSLVIAFTGEAGHSHGYTDEWDDDGVFHYFGEGQSGDMKYTGGNRAIENHVADGKRLLLFQMMGRGKPYRYLGEFVKLDSYAKPNTPATRGPDRTAIVFRLSPVGESKYFTDKRIAEAKPPQLLLADTVAMRIVETRKSQSLFRHRLLGVEKQCRLTGIQDLRFLRASHIKPWAACTTGAERTDGNNGLLLTPQADHLFDRGWITFEDNGRLAVSDELPADVKKRLGIDLRQGKNCGVFNPQQATYLEHHRAFVFGQKFNSSADPVEELFDGLLATAQSGQP